MGKPPSSGFRTAPDHETTAWPPGIGYIVGNEACERFSFYGMNAILYVHLVSLYVIATSVSEEAKNLATSTTHLFKASVYALPLIGAIIADRLAGKYKTIFWLSLVYCAGHAVLSAAENHLWGMYLGLGLIAVGSGGIKPCVSANVGDQFGRGNWFRVQTVFQIFYFSINFGSFFSTILIPRTKEFFGPSVAFAVPGVLMFIATLIFWAGRHKYVHVPPKPGGRLGLLDTLCSICLFLAIGHLFFTAHLHWTWIVFTSIVFLGIGLTLFQVRQSRQRDRGFLAIMVYTMGRHLGLIKAPAVVVPTETAAKAGDTPRWATSWFWRPAVQAYGVTAAEGPVAVLKIVSIFFLVSVFWSLFDQSSTSWIRQAETMDLTVWNEFTLLGVTIPRLSVLATEINAVNPLMVMILIPVMNLVYSLCARAGFAPTPLRRMTVGMTVSAIAFVVSALIQTAIDTQGPGKVSFLWQLVPYLLITVGEVLVSITGLEFAYTQAPKAMKSTIMGFWLLTVSLGNVLVALTAHFGSLPLASFLWVFAGLMAGAAVLFGLRAFFYTQKDYQQE